MLQPQRTFIQPPLSVALALHGPFDQEALIDGIEVIGKQRQFHRDSLESLLILRGISSAKSRNLCKKFGVTGSGVVVQLGELVPYGRLCLWPSGTRLRSIERATWWEIWRCHSR